MASRLALRIQERYGRLTRSEEKLAKFLLEHDDSTLLHSATDLSEKAGVSKATTARFFRNLGYSDFSEVKQQAREERDKNAPYQAAHNNKLVPDKYGDPSSGTSIGHHLDLELSNLTRTFESLNTELLHNIALLIKKAPKVWFLGLGTEEGLARYGRSLLARLRPDVNLMGVINGSWSEELAMVGPGDVLILLSLGTRHRIFKPILSFARTSRMRVVVITDHFSMPYYNGYADVLLPCHVASLGLGPSHVTLISALRFMANIYIDVAGEVAMHRAKIVEDIVEELDDQFY
ncbi:MAG: MurR/RpiR family transcriptional regulator [Thiolinea sp.]